MTYSLAIFSCPHYGQFRPGSRERFTPAYIQVLSVCEKDPPGTVKVTEVPATGQVQKLNSCKLEFALHAWRREQSLRNVLNVQSFDPYVVFSFSFVLVTPLSPGQHALWYASARTFSSDRTAVKIYFPSLCVCVCVCVCRHVRGSAEKFID